MEGWLCCHDIRVKLARNTYLEYPNSLKRLAEDFGYVNRFYKILKVLG